MTKKKQESEYSGRTTAIEHKFDDWKTKKVKDPVKAIQQRTIFEVQWTDCPVEVEAEVKQLWRDQSLGNDYYYAEWDDEEMCEDYPVISRYLRKHGVKECLIHWWW